MPRPTTGLAYLTVGLVVLGGLVFTVFVTIPAWSELASTRTRYGQTLTERDERRDFLANVAARAAELRANDPEDRFLAVVFPETKQPADFAVVLHAAASRNGVTVTALTGLESQKAAVPTAAPPEGEQRPGTGPSTRPAAPPREHSVEAKMTAQGTYAQLRSFIADLERSPRFLDVVTLDVAVLLAEQGILKADLTVATTLVPVPR